MKKIFAVVLVVCSLFAGIITVQGDTGVSEKNVLLSSYETGCETPEETAEAFVEAVKNKDFNAVISLYDCGHLAENYDYTSFIERMGIWQPSLNMSYPSKEGIFRNSTYIMLRGTAASQIINFCFSLNADEEYLDGKAKPAADDYEQIISDVGEFSKLDNIDSLKILRMDLAKPESQNSTQGKDITQKNCNLVAAEDWKDYGIFFEYDGKTYFGGMQLYKYDGYWYIDDLYSTYGGGTAYAYLTPMTEEEYIEQVLD